MGKLKTWKKVILTALENKHQTYASAASDTDKGEDEPVWEFNPL